MIHRRYIPVVFLLALAFSGCAKHDLVKKDESATPLTAPLQKDAVANPAQPSDSAATQQAIVSSQPAPPPVSAEGDQGGAAQAGVGHKDGGADLRRGLATIYFGFDSAALNDQARQKLVEDLELLKRHASQSVRIEGYCDERGSDEYNLALGERRAQAAARYLVTLGVPTQRLSTISYGNERPADPGHDESAWSKNRRDEFVVVP